MYRLKKVIEGINGGKNVLKMAIKCVQQWHLALKVLQLQLARNFKAVMGGLFYTHLLSCPFSEAHAASLEERLS